MKNNTLIELSLADGKATDEQLQSLAQDLASDLRRDLGAHSSFATTDSPGSGYRGDAVAIGKLVVELLTSSTAAALVNLLSAYFSRKPHLSFELKRADGEVVTVTSSDTDAKSFQQTVEKVQSFLPK